jgi:hypothetical protein
VSATAKKDADAPAIDLKVLALSPWTTTERRALGQLVDVRNTMAKGTFAAWLASLDDDDIAYLGGTILALVVVLVAGLVLLVRYCAAQQSMHANIDMEPAHAQEYEMLQVSAQPQHPHTLCPLSTHTLHTIDPPLCDMNGEQVIVVAHDQEAELEVQTDAWSSYEELRELVVDAVPNMFRDTDELTLEYKNEASRWVRVKMKTPVDAVKAARCARVTVPPSKPPSRALRR